MSGLSLSAKDADALERCIAGGGVAVIPTDTVYGVACDPASEMALRRIFEMKGRPPAKPAAVMYCAMGAAHLELGALPQRTRDAAVALLPGPVTLLLPNPGRRFPLACEPSRALEEGAAQEGALEEGAAQEGALEEGAAQEGAAQEGAAHVEPPPLGLRVPAWPQALEALAGVALPLLQSSANLSGQPPPRRLADVPEAIMEAADLVLDGGELPGLASTVIDLTRMELAGSFSIVREGALSSQAISAALSAVGERC